MGATAALLVPLALLDREMHRSGGPGIIPFELAGPARSAQILKRWGPKGRRAAQASLVLDYPFLVSYTVLNVRLTRRAGTALARRGRSRLGSLARAVAAVQVAAGACDAVENAALLAAVRGADERMSQVARVAAQAKFGGLLIGWFYGAAART